MSPLFYEPVGGVGALSPSSRGVGGPLTHGLRLSLEVGLNSGRFYKSSRYHLALQRVPATVPGSLYRLRGPQGP